MTIKGLLHVRLPEQLRRAAAMRAAQQGKTISDYVVELVRIDAEDLHCDKAHQDR